MDVVGISRKVILCLLLLSALSECASGSSLVLLRFCSGGGIYSFVFYHLQAIFLLLRELKVACSVKIKHVLLQIL